MCNRKRSFGAVALELYICWVAIKSTERKEFSTEASEELCCASRHSRDCIFFAILRKMAKTAGLQNGV